MPIRIVVVYDIQYPANHAISTYTAAAMSASSSTTAATAAKLYARKTIQKLSSLNINASNESILTISNWIIFNRKKVIDIGDGMLLYITENSNNSSSVSTNDSSETIGRLMLVVKIINQVLLFNCPTTIMDGGGVNNTTTTNDTTDDTTTDKWIKSSQLRIKLSEIVILPLWKAMATSLHTSDSTMKDQYNIEIKNILDNWKKFNVFDSVTILDEYKRGWNRALKDASTDDASKNDDGKKKEEEEERVEDDKPTASTDKKEADEKVVVAAAKEESSNNKVEQAGLTSEGTNENSNSLKNDEKEDVDMTDEKVNDEADDQNVPTSSPDEEEKGTTEGSGKKEVDQQVSSLTKRDSIANVEVDFEVRYTCVPCILMFEQADTT